MSMTHVLNTQGHSVSEREHLTALAKGFRTANLRRSTLENGTSSSVVRVK